MSTEPLVMTTLLPPIALATVAVIALVVSDYRNYRPGRYLFKPLAAAAFVWLALDLGAMETTYGNWMLAALLLCMVGDLFLMPDDERSFLLGLTAFLLGHLLFAIAFLQLPLNMGGMLYSGVPALLLLGLVCRWLLPHVGGDMKIPVLAYIAVITAMLACAGLTLGQAPAVLILAGAWGFALSDLAVATRQFVAPTSKLAGLWGTPLYFGSQMVLASSIALA